MYIPGALESAENFRSEMEKLAPRRTLAISWRGASKSDAPETGYSLEDQVADAEAVMEAALKGRFCLMAYSTGVPRAIGLAARHPRRVAGLILIDYPARYPAIPESWAERVLSSSQKIPERAVWAVQRESREVLLWDRLREIRCPVLVLRGGGEGSLLKEADAALFRERLSRVEIAVMPEAGHDVWNPDYDRFFRTVVSFLEERDREARKTV
jgi:pimeloyl-ACP methyl ester carboxylesterase